MKHSDSINEIAAALVKAQTEIKAAIKDSTNPFFKNKYADLASVIEAVRLPLNKAGICFLQPASSVPEGVAVETILIHQSGQWLSETITMPVNKQDAQAFGSACTYGRRYGLQSLCGVPSEDDDGERAVKAPATPSKITPTAGAWEAMSPEQQSRLTDLATVVKEYCEDQDYASAYEAIDAAALETEERVALATRLDSKVRTPMTKWRKENPKQYA
jgi:hypothetical protein